MAGFVGHEAKCAGCREYFRPDRLRQEENAYYCRRCYSILRRKERICPVCGKVLTPYDAVTRDGDFNYCPDCYDRVTSPDGTRNADSGTTDYRCSECGKALAPGEARALYANNCYCIACYEKVSPHLDAKPFWLQPGDAVASLRTGCRVCCSRCNRDLGPLDVRIRDGQSVFCESCYRDVRGTPPTRFYVAERAGLNTRPPVTSVRNGADLVECANCGWVITRDRLETLERDARGKLRCSHCGKKFEAPPKQAPEKAPSTMASAKMDPEDFALTAQLFKCLGDPCRVKIIESLSEKELCVFEFVELTGSQYSAISYHLKMLKELGIVRSYERGNFMVYSLTDKGQIVHEFIGKSRELK